MKLAAIKQKNIFRWFSAVLLLMAVIWNPLPGFAQDSNAMTHSPISLEVEVTPKQATVGDLITYSVRVRHDSNIEPSPPKFLPPEGLETVDQGIRELPRKKSQVQQEFWFRLRADLVGSYEFPALSIPFIVSSDENEDKIIPGQVFSPKAQVEIQSVLRLEGEPTDIRDIKPLENISRDWRPIIFGVLAALLVIALVVFLFLKRRKDKSAESPFIQETLTAQEIALRDLDVLQNKGLLEKGLVREYYFELSEIFRRYLGTKFQFPALDWTTEEIKHFLKHSSRHNPGINERISFILENTDLVKFAKAQVSAEDNMTEEVILFIQETSRPVESQPHSNNPATLS